MTNRDFFRVVLPWPNWDISPNGTHNRKYRTALTKSHRTLARYAAIGAIGYRNWIDADVAFSIWLFRQPNKIHRDTGNIRSAMKAYQDGVADALKIDDHVIKDEHLHLDGYKDGGEVELRIYEDVVQWLDDVRVLVFDAYGE